MSGRRGGVGRHVGVVALALATTAPGSARAHPEAALSPEFATSGCIQRVDLRETQKLPLPYTVAYDDVDFTEGDIVLPDAKTHQFFAFRGAVAPYLLGSQLFPFAEESAAVRVLPEWITTDDVGRAAAASNAMDATGFIAEQVDVTDVLQQRDDLAPFWLRITPDAGRVPIRIERAELGLAWDLSGVPPGAYQVAGYVFSPPYNAWAARPGVIKLVDGTRDFPALALAAIDGTVYGGQGRRVSGCIDAPEGTELAASFRSEDQPGQPWQPLADAPQVQDGKFSFCFRSPDRELSGVLRIRVQATAPDGTQAFAHTPDTLVLVATPANCTPSESVCCAEKPAGMEPEPPPAMQPAEPPTLGKAGAGGSSAAMEMPAAPMAMQPMPGGAGAPPLGMESSPRAAGGCSATAPQGFSFSPSGAALALAFAALHALARRRRV
jgi:uncharacterized protein (TIGR03382 family)